MKTFENDLANIRSQGVEFKNEQELWKNIMWEQIGRHIMPPDYRVDYTIGSGRRVRDKETCDE